MTFKYQDVVVSTDTFLRMESKTEQETATTTETNPSKEATENPSIPQTTEDTSKADEELLKEYKEYTKSVKAGIGDSVMITMFCGIGIYILCGLIMALLLSKYFKIR